ncbi:MAG: GNAT family N-acetyltransferase [Nitrosomonadales bacterium]|nr:GNAT family N-acetyltransferase [Nitrosomonadales bacterium]
MPLSDPFKDDFCGTAFRRAAPADAADIVALVNSAYRGDSSRAGWTTEADLLGGQRTDTDEIARLIAQDGSAMLLYMRGDGIVGSVHVAREDAATAYMGMLVVRPVLQGKGLGGLLMAEAERFVRDEWGAARVRMQVIMLRHELIAWYGRRGYRRIGERKPFPYGDPRFGLPKVEGLVFEVLEKGLGEPAGSISK